MHTCLVPPSCIMMLTAQLPMQSTGTEYWGLFLEKLNQRCLDKYLMFIPVFAHKGPENSNSSFYPRSCWGGIGLLWCCCRWRPKHTAPVAAVQIQLLWLGPEGGSLDQGPGCNPGLAHEHTRLHVRPLLRGLAGRLEHLVLPMEAVACATGREVPWHCSRCDVPTERGDTPSTVAQDPVAPRRARCFQLSCTSES